VNHPSVPWVQWGSTTQGFVARCDACGAQGALGTPQAVDAFAAQHQEHRSASVGHYGAGDAVAAATRALGIDSCTPCERRRQQLNGLLPRVWRR